MNIDSFRTANNADVEDIIQLVNHAYRPISNNIGWTSEAGIVSGERVTAQELRDTLQKTAFTLLVATKNNAIIGCIEIEQRGNSSHFGMLAVNPALQGKGLGKQILSYAENYARLNFNAEKFSMIVMSLRPDLIAFYQRRGYQKNGLSVSLTIPNDLTPPQLIDFTFEVLEKSAAVCLS